MSTPPFSISHDTEALLESVPTRRWLRILVGAGGASIALTKTYSFSSALLITLATLLLVAGWLMLRNYFLSQQTSEWDGATLTITTHKNNYQWTKDKATSYVLFSETSGLLQRKFLCIGTPAKVDRLNLAFYGEKEKELVAVLNEISAGVQFETFMALEALKKTPEEYRFLLPFKLRRPNLFVLQRGTLFLSILLLGGFIVYHLA